VATYRHNPYRARVIKCRVIPTREDLADGSSALSDQVVPLCPCVAQSRQFSQEITPITSEGTSPITPSPLIPVRQPAAAVTTDTPKPKSMCCYFKQKGCCKMGDKCWHGHEGDLYTPCHFGSNCKAGHATLAQMQQQQLSPQGTLAVAPVRTLHDSAASLIAMQSRVSIRIGVGHLQQPKLHF